MFLPFAATTLAVIMPLSVQHPATHNALCVRPGGGGGCYSTIQAAVNAAAPHDVVHIRPGRYKEDVIVGKPLSLEGAGAAQTIIDASGQSNAIYIDGLDSPGLGDVRVENLSARSANFEGILATNASHLLIRNTFVAQNDRALQPSGPACPGLPSFETDEAFDCGGGIHVMGVTHSVIAANVMERNADGLLVSDDTGATNDNQVEDNLVRQNPTDCGIVMASHPPAPGSSAPHNGIVRNVFTGNVSTHNGYAVPGAGAGIGIFSDGTGPGLVAYNVISHNTLTANGLPGVAIHSHVGGDNLNNNVIVDNRISKNGPDEGDTATPGPTGINVNSGFGGTRIKGTIISGNIISNEAIDVAVNTPATVALHNNDLLGAGMIGVDNLGSGAVDATFNWWGCPDGPGSSDCSSIAGQRVKYKPWLRHPAR